jgi:hypothetical protein
MMRNRIVTFGLGEQRPAELADSARGNAGKHAASNEFRSLLGHALARSTRAVNPPGGAERSAPKPAAGHDWPAASTAGAPACGAGARPPLPPIAKAVELVADRATGAGVPERETSAVPSPDGEGTEKPASRAPRRPADRKRRQEVPGADPSAALVHGHAVAAAPAAQNRVSPARDNEEKPSLTRDGVARLATAHAVKQPLATPSPAKPSLGSGRERERPPLVDREGTQPPTAQASSRSPRLEPGDVPPAPEPKAAWKPDAPEPTIRTAAPLPPPPAGQEVGGAVLRNAAHLRVETGELGALSLHLRVLEGALHLRVDGEAAAVVEARAGELSRALAGEGLRLAPIETPSREGAGVQSGTSGGGGGTQSEGRREAWNEAAETRGMRPEPARDTHAVREMPVARGEAGVRPGGVHVKA